MGPENSNTVDDEFAKGCFGVDISLLGSVAVCFGVARSTLLKSFLLGCASCFGPVNSKVCFPVRVAVLAGVAACIGVCGCFAVG